MDTVTRYLMAARDTATVMEDMDTAMNPNTGGTGMDTGGTGMDTEIMAIHMKIHIATVTVKYDIQI